MSGGGRRLLVFGAGGHGKVVADVARSAGYAVAGFIEDGEARHGAAFFGASIVAWTRLLAARAGLDDVAVALGIGDNAARQACQGRVLAAGLEVATLVHARATVAPTARLGPGTVVMAGAVVNPDATVGEGGIVNTGAVVEHDCVLGAFVHLSPNAALGGAARIGARTHLGLGAVALPRVVVGSDVTVGAGAVVTRDVGDGLTVVGVPARPLAGTGPERSSR